MKNGVIASRELWKGSEIFWFFLNDERLDTLFNIFPTVPTGFLSTKNDVLKYR